MMKKAITFCTCFLIVCSSLTACGKTKNSEYTNADISQQETILSTSTQTKLSTTKAAITTSIASESASAITTKNSTGTDSQSAHTSVTEQNANDELNAMQKNSIAWLNYLAMLSQEINDSQNNKMYLEEAYSALINNTNPENVDEDTKNQLLSLMNIIDAYRFTEQKRERLQYIYEQNQAKAIKEAIPDPVAFLSTTVSFDLKKIAASVLYMAVESYSSYTAYNNEINQAYLKEGWELDDETNKILSRNRSRSFEYMVDITQKYNLPGNLSLTEDAVKDFVGCKNDKNVDQQLQFLESHKGTYQAFSEYWILLAECYYNDEQYQKCLDCISAYEELNLNIFRVDYNLAKVLPLAIIAASNTQSQSTYIQTAEKYLDMLIQNTKESEWSLRYFAATTYTDLYKETHDKKYLRQAYDILVNNVNSLIAKQTEMNQAYLADIEEVPVPKGSTKEETKNIKEYNKELKKNRKTELPETYEPLALNCDLLFSIANQIDLSQTEKDRVDGILYGNNCPAFLTEPLQNLFSFDEKSNIESTAVYEKDKLTLPVSCLSKDAVIKVTVSDGDQSVVYDDWKIDSVDRPKGDSENIENFKAVYTSKNAKKYKWSKNSTVTVEISNGEYANSKPFAIHFKVSNFKDRKILWDTVEFEQID